jgi:hypothetical protein
MAEKVNVASYDTDFFKWTQQQAEALAAGKASELDWANLAEEIESLGRRDWRALESRLDILLMHLLKWIYQPERRQTGRSWASTIREQRLRIGRILRDSPSLRRQVPELLATSYQNARLLGQDETGLSLETFPEACPWTAEQVLDETFWPDHG